MEDSLVGLGLGLRATWLLHLASVAFMTGLIWLIQLVHYPLMDRVAPERFAEFHAAHSARISLIVGPVMVLELVSAAGLALAASSGAFPRLLGWSCITLSVGVFAATAFLSVPQHALLGSGFVEAAHSRLVSTNWVRTILWTLHLVICLGAAITSPGELK